MRKRIATFGLVAASLLPVAPALAEPSTPPATAAPAAPSASPTTPSATATPAAPTPTATAARPDVAPAALTSTLTNANDGVYRGQKLVYVSSSTLDAPAPAGTLATLNLDAHTPVYAEGAKPSVTLRTPAGATIPVTITTVSPTQLTYAIAEPVPAGSVLETRTVAVVSGAAAGTSVTTTFTVGASTASDTDAVSAMPLVHGIEKTFTDELQTTAAGDQLTYTATATFSGGPMDGATLLIKESPLAKITGRPTLEVRDASGAPLAIEPERLLFSRYGDSSVLTVLGATPVGTTFTVRATATVAPTAQPGDIIHAEFGVGLNNWDRSSKLVRAVDETRVAPVEAPAPTPSATPTVTPTPTPSPSPTVTAPGTAPGSTPGAPAPESPATEAQAAPGQPAPVVESPAQLAVTGGADAAWLLLGGGATAAGALLRRRGRA